jgi:hypothetical protein
LRAAARVFAMTTANSEDMVVRSGTAITTDFFLFGTGLLYSKRRRCGSSGLYHKRAQCNQEVGLVQEALLGPDTGVVSKLGWRRLRWTRLAMLGAKT